MTAERKRILPDSPAPNDPSPDPRAGCARCAGMDAEDARDIEMLRELAELSMAMARAMQAQFMAQVGGQTGTQGADNPAPAGNGAATGGNQGGDPGLAFSRVARTVRQTIALKRRIADDAAERDREAAETAQSRVEDRKRRVERGVRRAICNEADDMRRGYLYEDLREKMDAYEAEGVFDLTTGNEMIDLLMREIGIADDEDEDDEAGDDGPEAANDAAGPGPVAGRSAAGRGGRDPP